MILATTTFDFDSDLGVLSSLRLAEARNEELFLLHCVESPLIQLPHFESDFKSELELAHTRAEEQFKRLELSKPPRLDIKVGHPGRTIGEVSRELQASTIILGPHRPRGVFDGLLGSTVDHVLRTVDSPCLRVTRKLASPPRRLLFGTDFSPKSKTSLLKLAQWLSSFSTGLDERPIVLELVYVHAFATGLGGHVQALDFGKLFQELQNEIPKLAHVKTRTRVLGAPTVFEGIQRAAEDLNADIVALGTQGYNVLARLLLGSVAVTCSHRLNFPVMLLSPNIVSQP